MAKGRLTPRKEQAIATRLKIFDTAVELFEKKGYDRVSINDICKKAGVSTGAFYHYFKSKDQVLREKFLEIDDFTRDLMEDISDMNNAIDKL